MDRQEIGLPEQILLRDQRRAASLRFLLSKVLTPGNQPHADRLADLADFRPELAEAQESECLAGELDAERRLPEHAGLHAVVLVTDLARELEHDADRKLGGRLAGGLRAAYRHAACGGIFEIDRRVAHA